MPLGAASVSVRINDQNSSPVVTVSTTPSPAEVPGRGTVTLDGTSSDSDEEDTLTYAWTVAPANVGSFGDAASEDTTWTAPAPLLEKQSVTLTLTVTDDGTPTGTKAVDVEGDDQSQPIPDGRSHDGGRRCTGREHLNARGGGDGPGRGRVDLWVVGGRELWGCFGKGYCVDCPGHQRRGPGNSPDAHRDR